ncbi:transferase family protein [Penicillium argentinense]|uniref:Transferase family protein n=1 Tax=Penicillium argentinense TaxID=1131581 RepID=A0A9W9G6Y0_9EURO|nr:transferase family protein [Penicillium argentinense]KAJ5112507.1 transferase family protein [Penicillium argentinense]
MEAQRRSLRHPLDLRFLDYDIILTSLRLSIQVRRFELVQCRDAYRESRRLEGSIVAIETTVVQSERLFPNTKSAEKAVPLSLLDATTADFSSTTAIWLFDQPKAARTDIFDLFEHFRQSLRIVLDDYPQLAGLLKSIQALDSTKLEPETLQFPPHSRRFGRVYAHYGLAQDPGVEFITAISTATIESLCPASRTKEQPLLDRQKVPLDSLIHRGRLSSAIQTLKPDAAGLLPPSCVVQVTKLACGGFTLAAKIAHPLADIQSLVYFVKDWAKISRWVLSGAGIPKPSLAPVFEPERLDSMAAGDINREDADSQVLEQINALPLHRFDWWAAPAQCPWPQEVPEPFRDEDLTPVGKTMQWSEWDIASPVSHYTVHFTRDQVDWIWKNATNQTTEEASSDRISRHDAILAHVWSCIARARNQQRDRGLVHCNLTYGTRPALQLGDNFIGSPILMINVELTGAELALAQVPENEKARSAAQRIRQTIKRISRPEALAAHLHSVAYEKAPQRIWQAFMGSRHLIVTSWARIGIYDVDFGLDSRIRYAEGVIPDLDGDVLIKDAPPSDPSRPSSERLAWTEDGVDASIHIRAEDMDRLIGDPHLLPRCT